MKIDLIKLVYDQEKEIFLNKEVVIDSSYLTRSEIKSLSPIKVSGNIYKDSLDRITINIDISGEMTLTDSRSLEDVSYPFATNYTEILEENDNFKQNTLDIEPILWENVVLEVPIRVISDRPVPASKGEGWELKDID